MNFLYKIEKISEGRWQVVSYEVPDISTPSKNSLSTRGEYNEKILEMEVGVIKNRLVNICKKILDNASNHVYGLPFSVICDSLGSISEELIKINDQCNILNIKDQQNRALSSYIPMGMLDIVNINGQYILLSNSNSKLNEMSYPTFQRAFDDWDSYVRNELRDRLVLICESIISVVNGCGISMYDLDTILKMVNDANDFSLKCSYWE